MRGESLAAQLEPLQMEVGGPSFEGRVWETRVLSAEESTLEPYSCVCGVSVCVVECL